MRKVISSLAIIAIILSFVSCSSDNDAEAYNNRAVAKERTGDYKDAIADYDKAIEINPKFAEAYYNRGIAKESTGDYKGAIADWGKAIELNPSLKDKLQPRIDSAREKLK